MAARSLSHGPGPFFFGPVHQFRRRGVGMHSEVRCRIWPQNNHMSTVLAPGGMRSCWRHEQASLSWRPTPSGRDASAPGGIAGKREGGNSACMQGWSLPMNQSSPTSQARRRGTTAKLNPEGIQTTSGQVSRRVHHLPAFSEPSQQFLGLLRDRSRRGAFVLKWCRWLRAWPPFRPRN